MAEVGQKYIVQISTDSGSTYTDIGYAQSFSLGRERDLIDITSFNDASWATFLSGQRSWSIQVDTIYTYDDTGQNALDTAIAADSSYPFKITSEASTAGVYEFSGSGFVASYDIEGATNEVVTSGVEITGTGALTRAVIS